MPLTSICAITGVDHVKGIVKYPHGDVEVDRPFTDIAVNGKYWVPPPLPPDPHAEPVFVMLPEGSIWRQL